MIPSEFLAPYLIANAVALAVLVLAIWRPRVARWVGAAVFLWAAITNAVTVIRQPEVYLEYAALTPSALYAAFITGWFASHIQVMVLSIAAGQLAVAGLLALGRPWRLGGVLGAVVFLLAIAPLGVGSGFPFSLTFGAGLILADRGVERRRRTRLLAACRLEGALADRFIPEPDVFECHDIFVHAPADVVFDVARRFDLLSIPLVRGIFRLRSWVLGGVPPPDAWPAGLVDMTLDEGWRVLAERPGRELVVGALTRPWEANVVFRGKAPDAFITCADAAMVKIVWTLEARPVAAGTRLRTQTRVVATDAEARRRFRRYWAVFGIGIVMIRVLVLPAMRRQAERRAARGGGLTRAQAPAG